MSGRAVGGAAGVGCGAFGLVGLLVGVGLTVWLGMRVTSSVGDGVGAARSTTTLPGAVDPSGHGLSGLGTLTVPGGATGTGRLEAGPSTGLSDGAPVRVAGSGLAPGATSVTQCLRFETRAAGVDGACDDTTSVAGTVTASGDLVVGTTARRVITVLDTRYDCAAFAGACVLVAHDTGALVDIAEAPLSFAPAGPVDAEIPPKTS